MQEEVTKHTKKIYHLVKDRNKKLAEKIKEILIEIFIIVFAVTLSIWLHSWSEHRHEQHEAREFLRGLKEDLGKDIKLLQGNRDNIIQLDSNFRFLKSYQRTGSAGDSAAVERLRVSIPVTHLNTGRYEGFKSSGKLESLENDSLKQAILVFYQQAVPEVGYNESFVNSVQLKVLDAIMDKSDKMTTPELIMTWKMKSLFTLAANNFDNGIRLYNEAIDQAGKIIAEIDKEIAE